MLVLSNQLAVAIPEDDVKKVAVQALQACYEFHVKDILHLDLKSMNLFVTSKGDIKIGDLGLSLSEDTLRKYFGQSFRDYASTRGSLAWMAVELW